MTTPLIPSPPSPANVTTTRDDMILLLRTKLEEYNHFIQDVLIPEFDIASKAEDKIKIEIDEYIDLQQRLIQLQQTQKQQQTQTQKQQLQKQQLQKQHHQQHQQNQKKIYEEDQKNSNSDDDEQQKKQEQEEEGTTTSTSNNNKKEILVDLGYEKVYCNAIVDIIPQTFYIHVGMGFHIEFITIQEALLFIQKRIKFLRNDKLINHCTAKKRKQIQKHIESSKMIIDQLSIELQKMS